MRGSELTEKVAKPIANFHPFVVFGSSGATKKIENLGFKTFNRALLNLPDDYEKGITSTVERLMHLIRGIKRFRKLSREDKTKLLKSLEPAIEYNYNHLINTDWLKVAHDELIRNDLPFLPLNIRANSK